MFPLQVLSVLDEALSVLSSHKTAPPPEGVAHTALLCLQLLGATLEREEEFLDCVRRSKEQTSVHYLHQLLLQAVNPRSGGADHMINIARSALGPGDLERECLVIECIVCLSVFIVCLSALCLLCGLCVFVFFCLSDLSVCLS